MQTKFYFLSALTLIGIFVIALFVYQIEFSFEIKKQNSIENTYDIIDTIQSLFSDNNIKINQELLHSIAKNNQEITIYDKSLVPIASSVLQPSILPFELTKEKKVYENDSDVKAYVCEKNDITICIIEEKMQLFAYPISDREEEYLTLFTIGIIMFAMIFTGFYLLSSNLKLRESLEHTNKEILEKNKELEILHKEKNEFAEIASHELRTPLVPIKGFAEMLQHEENLQTGELKKIFSKIYKNASRMDRLIENIILAQKLESNQVKIHKKRFSVGPMIEEIIDSFSENNPKNIQFTKNMKDEITMYSDQDKIHEIITNLILNAVDFVPENHGQISIDVQEENDKVVFSVSDNGVGISKENLDKLFLKYYQVDNSITRKHTGFGLGLSICKSLVETLGGQIHANSKEGQGTTFYFEIPRDIV